jgi:hypothetical protein
MNRNQTSDTQKAASDEYEWITIVKDKKPNETWRQYAKRAATYYGLSEEVSEQYAAGIQRGMKPRVAALEALEMLHCDDNENRETIRVFRSRAKWVERPRLLKVPNALLEFMEDNFTFTPYRCIGKSHTEIVLDDSEVFALLMVCSVIADGKIPAKVKKIAREGHRAVRMLMRRDGAR